MSRTTTIAHVCVLMAVLLLSGPLQGRILNETAANAVNMETPQDPPTGCVPPPPPTNTTPSIYLTICSGSNTFMSVSGSGSISWHSAASGGILLGTGPFYLTQPLTSTTTFYAEDSTCAASTSRTAITITVNPRPSVSISSSSNSVCSGSAVTLGASGGNSYNWQPGNLNTGSITVVPSGTTVYTVTASNSFGCTKTETKLIVVNQRPTITNTTTAANLCQGQFTSITASGASFYNWFPGGLSGTTQTFTPSATTTYTIVGVDPVTVCTNTSTRTITVNPLPSVGTTATQSSICLGNSTTISATGASTYTWMPGNLSGSDITVSPTASTTYTVTGISSAGCSKTSTRTITVTPPCSSVLNLKLYLQGYYTGSGLMNAVLMNQGVAGATSTMTDSISVELRNSVSPYEVLHAIKPILNTDGTVQCNFPISGSYYLAIKHRNGLQTWSAGPVTLSNATPATYDFSTAAGQAYNGNQINLGNNVFGFYSGDINQDENIDISDLALLETDISLFASGYVATDISGEGNVDILDAPILEFNINNFIYAMFP